MRSGSNTVNTLKQIDMESVRKAEKATLSIKQGKNKRTQKEENKIGSGRVQMIQNMVVGNIKCESVSLCAIILSDVETLNHFSRDYIFSSSGTIIS
jgi:hypothetical protein